LLRQVVETRDLHVEALIRAGDAVLLLIIREAALDTLAREELGLNPDDLGSPWGAALWSFVSFAFGAVLPLVPWFAASGDRALQITLAISLVSLFTVGCTLSLFTGRNALASGVRMVLIGSAAGAATWLIGRWMGVQIA
jgi:VIT1/CCC1 family predicted Fe2+/Mn2+ transporter